MARRMVAASVAAVLAACLAATPAVDRRLLVRMVTSSHGAEVRFTSGTCLEATVTVDLKLVNLRAPCTLPVTLDFRRDGPPIDVALEAIDATRPFHVNCTWHDLIGCRRPTGSATQPAAFDYDLPYPAGEQYEVTQGACGRSSHERGGLNEQCVDFGMPIGSTVCAARAGTVIGVRDDSDRGGPLPSFGVDANFIVLKQEDGTCAEYLHLAKHGALVNLRQQVRQGQAIGRSGSTGFATGPHLHFGVFNNVDGATRTTYPLTFTMRVGHHQALQEGVVYAR